MQELPMSDEIDDTVEVGSSHGELEADFWRRHYSREKPWNVPHRRLWERMHEDGHGSLAHQLWCNQWDLLNTNSARVWLPDHPTTVRKLWGLKSA